MKAVLRRIFFLFFILTLFSTGKVIANGCTGSWFNVVYSPWCDCYQICGNFISDCDDIVSLNWNFGDGTTATGGSPCHHYTTPGTYTITMTVTAHCHNFWPFSTGTTTCNITRQVVVTTTSSGLTAGFVADTVCRGNGTLFTNTSVVPPGSTNTYQWTFGDGTTGTGANPTHVFDSCGVYDVTMIVTNSAPCCALTGSDTVVQRVVVNCNPFDESNQLGDLDPYIEESDAQVATVSGACAGSNTQFNLTNNGPITNWVWTFPDSSTSTSTTPSYVYTACPPAVNYTNVNLTTNRGCTGMIDSITGIFCPSNIALSSTMTLCTGQCSGTATVNMSGGGNPPFTVVWNDPASQTTFTATGLCPGPYNVTVTDGNGCNATPATPITVPDFPFPFIGTSTIVGNVLCYGWFGGSALLTYSGGTPPYTVYWDNGATTMAVTGLSGGNHTVIGTDGHGCVTTNIVNIPQPPPVTGTVNPVNAGCNVCDGSATVVNPTGGHGTFVYRWNTTPGQFTATATGLCAGTYQVIVEDATVWGCGDTILVPITENGSTPITTLTSNATCANICDGSALAQGCGACTYIWLDSTGTSIGQTSGSALNLCSGTYTVQATNGAGCSSFATATISIPNPIVATATPTANTCGGTCNGTITASGTGGGGTYTYQWYDSGNNPIAGQTASTINNLCAGNYSVRLTDPQGCIEPAYATVLDNQMVSSATATSVLCNGDCNGMITAVTSGGRSPYSYVVQNSSGATVYSGASSIIANLCAGSYNVIVSDVLNCSLTIPVSISQPSAVNPVPSSVLPSCFGSCNGSVSVTVTGGTAPYTYDWRFNGASLPGGTLPTVNNLCAGSYAVKVADANNCVTPYIPVVLTQPEVLDDTMVIIDPYCTQGQGSIDLTVTGGTGPYTFSWNNGAYTTEDISGLSQGTYTVVITDANNCTTTDNATFVQLPNLAVTVFAYMYNGYHIKCNGSNSGEVVVRVSGGLPPYTYLWNDSAGTTVDSIYGLPAGTYSVTVTDANGCVRVDSVALNIIPPPFSVSAVKQDITCAGANDGMASVVPLGGVPPYFYYWGNDTATANQPLTGLDTGQYIVYVFDSVNCLRWDTVDITEPEPMVVSHTSIDVSCFNGSDGNIDLTVSGGVIPYSFSWNGGTYTTEDITAVTAGQYIVIITDSNGCTLADTTLITQPPSMVTSLATVNVSCFGGNDGSITLTASGGALPYSYNWNNGQFTTQDISGLTIGRYVVVVTDNNSCTVADSADIFEPALITGTRNVSVCIGDSFFLQGAFQKTPGIYVDTLIAANNCDSILSTDLSFVSQFATQFAQAICFGERFLFNGTYYSAAGTYTGNFISTGGCDSIVTLTLSVFNDIGIYATPDKASLLVGESITVNIYTNSNNIISYTWSPTTGITCADSICESALVGPDVDTRYTIVAVDANGCRDTVVVPILVAGPVIFIPNVFTPNRDNANDYFEIYGNKDALRFLEVKIFNRWGEKVFESNDLNFKWDGRYKGEALMPAVFVYTIRVVFVNAKQPEKIYKGSVTLMK